MSKRNFNKPRRTRLQLEAKRILEAQAIKHALDKLAPMTTQTELENNPKHADPFYYPQDEPDPKQKERDRLLDLTEQIIDIIRENLKNT